MQLHWTFLTPPPPKYIIVCQQMWSLGLSRRLLQGLLGCSVRDTAGRTNMKSRKALRRYVCIITTKHLQKHALFALVSCTLSCFLCLLVPQVGKVAFMGIDDIYSNSLSSWSEIDGMGECDLPACLCDLWNFLHIEASWKKCITVYIKLINKIILSPNI